MTVAPTPFSTGIGSPVSIDSFDRRAALDEDAVDRDLLARPDAQQVAGLDGLERHVRLDVAGDDPSGRRLQADEPPDRAGRLALGPGLQPAAEQDEADDERGRVEVRLGLAAGLHRDHRPEREHDASRPTRPSSRRRRACPCSSCRGAARARRRGRSEPPAQTWTNVAGRMASRLRCSIVERDARART